jgi:hypothetical protein
MIKTTPSTPSGKQPPTVFIPLAHYGDPIGVPHYVLLRVCQKMAIPLYHYAQNDYITLENSHRLESAIAQLQQGLVLKDIPHLGEVAPCLPLTEKPRVDLPAYTTVQPTAYSVGHSKGRQWLQQNGKVYHTPQQILQQATPRVRHPKQPARQTTGLDNKEASVLPRALQRMAPAIRQTLKYIQQHTT